jgi:putative endonuclease
MQHFVYIMASRPYGAIYIGMARDLRRRVDQHRAGIPGSHTDRYNIRKLVWFEGHPNFAAAFTRERQMKEWQRAWKIRLIVAVNPEWRDVTVDIPWD